MAANKSTHKCPHCGDSDPSHFWGSASLCKPCNRISRTAHRNARRAAGLCIRCGTPNDRETSLCSSCYADHCDGVAKRAASRPCACGNPTRAPYDGRCPQCLAQKVRERNKLLKQKVYDHYGHSCSCCGETSPAFLTIDHVNNDGWEHRKTVAPAQLYGWLVRNGFPADFQILCYNCNCGRYRNGGTCPHKAA